MRLSKLCVCVCVCIQGNMCLCMGEQSSHCTCTNCTLWTHSNTLQPDKQQTIIITILVTGVGGRGRGVVTIVSWRGRCQQWLFNICGTGSWR